MHTPDGNATRDRAALPLPRSITLQQPSRNLPGCSKPWPIARSNRNHVLLQEEPVWHLLFSEIHRLRATGPIASKIFYPYRSVYHAKTVGNIESPRQKFYRKFGRHNSSACF